MNKIGQRNPNWLQLVLALFVGFILVISIPQAKTYFDNLMNAVIVGIILGLVVGGIIFGIWFFMESRQ